MMDNREVYRKIGLRIAYIRRSCSLSQEALAEMAGISAGFLAQIEAPGVDSKMSLDTLLAIAGALDIELKELFDFG